MYSAPQRLGESLILTKNDTISYFRLKRKKPFLSFFYPFFPLSLLAHDVIGLRDLPTCESLDLIATYGAGGSESVRSQGVSCPAICLGASVACQAGMACSRLTKSLGGSSFVWRMPHNGTFPYGVE